MTEGAQTQVEKGRIFRVKIQPLGISTECCAKGGNKLRGRGDEGGRVEVGLAITGVMKEAVLGGGTVAEGCSS